MNYANASFLLNAINFTPRETLRALLTEKADDILRHAGHRVRVRLAITRATPAHAEAHFLACARAEQEGADAITHAQAGEPDTAGSAALAKLERIVIEQCHRQTHARWATDVSELSPTQSRT